MNTFKHPKAQKVLGFLQAKGLLLVQNMKPRHFEKIPVLDALWVAEHIEPRVLEVLPAALLHYPRTFLFHEQLPDELKKIIQDIKKGRKMDLEYKGIKYQDMFRWANEKLNDQRTKKEEHKKYNVTFRLNMKHKKKLEQLAKYQKKTMTSVIESLIDSQK